MTRDIRIDNIQSYVQLVCDLASSTKNAVTFDDAELLYRGQPDNEYELLPAIGRNRSFACDYTIFNEERNLIEMAKYKLPDVFNKDLSPVELLALLQHHGIPTRLLDISENPLVALYFACIGSPSKDGEVIVFNNQDIDVTNYPIINAIADSYRFTRGTWTSLAHFYGDIKNQPYFLEQKQTLEIVHKDAAVGGKWIAECCDKILYIYAPTRSLRQQAQRGRYILFPNHIDYEFDAEGCFEWRLDAIPKDHQDIIKRIIIPKERKNELIKALSILGISEGFLFSDNIDVVCKEILASFQKKCNSR